MESLSCTKIAGHLRAQLKDAFPAVKFSVKSTSSTLNVIVTWVDGPTLEQVAELTRPLRGGYLDRSTNEFIHANPITVTTRNGEVTGISIVGGFKHQRSFSPDMLDEARKLWTEQSGMEVRSEEAERGWHDWARVRGVDIKPGNVEAQVQAIASLVAAGLL